MSDLTKRFSNFFGERRTSPMYKSFIISRCIRNWNFLYTIILEKEIYILEKFGHLKHIYIKNLLYIIDWEYFGSLNIFDKLVYTFSFQSGIWHIFLGPAISVILFFYVFSRIDKKIIIKDIRNKFDLEKLKVGESIELKKLQEEEIQNQINILTAEYDKKEKENKILLASQEAEINKLQQERSIETKSENNILEQRTNEYNEIESDFQFLDAMNKLKTLTGHVMQNEEIDTLNKYGYILITYDLYKKGSSDFDGYTAGFITEKGKFFLRKFISKNDIKHPYVSKSSYESEINLPF